MTTPMPEFVRKTGESNIGNCPALYRLGDGWVVQGKTDVGAYSGGYVVSGVRVNADAWRATLRDLTPDEDAVWISHDTLAAIAAGEPLPAEGGHISVWVPADVVEPVPA